jgi:hypothetical protein
MSRDAGNEFNALLLTAVDRALSESMGDSVSGALKVMIPVSSVTTDPEGFALKLERLTGGTKLVEKKIMHNLELLISQRGATSSLSEHQDFCGFIESCRGQFRLSR